MPGIDENEGSLVYIDANPFIYLVESDLAVAAALKPLFEAFLRRPGVAATSELTLAEVLVAPSRPLPIDADVRQRAYMSLIVWRQAIALKPVDRDVLLDTVDLRKERRLRLPDAIHLATALRSRCQFFLSGDADFRAMPAGMSLVRPGRDSLDPILEALG